MLKSRLPTVWNSLGLLFWCTYFVTINHASINKGKKKRMKEKGGGEEERIEG